MDKLEFNEMKQKLLQIKGEVKVKSVILKNDYFIKNVLFQTSWID